MREGAIWVVVGLIVLCYVFPEAANALGQHCVWLGIGGFSLFILHIICVFAHGLGGTRGGRK